MSCWEQGLKNDRQAGGIIDWTLKENFKLELNDKKEGVVEEQCVETAPKRLQKF